MHATHLTLAMLFLLPFALAHDPAGTPKNYCESPSDWGTHDYVVGTGQISVRGPAIDGNISGDCDGLTSGSPCTNVDPNDPTATSADICDFSPPIADFDGHREFSIGWARLLACDTACGASGNGLGASGCSGDEAHHNIFGPISVDDALLGSTTSFYVMTDGGDATFPCGDGQVNPGISPGDDFTECVGICYPTFVPGADGSYIVVVLGTMGHITG